MAELGQQTVEFSALVRRAAEESFLSLKELVERSRSAEQAESEKKIELLKYILKTRQRMLRLHVLAKWCQQVPLVQYCQQLASTLSSHDTCFTQAADSLFFMHEGLQQARAPIYDVPSAIEVLLSGSYQRLPKCVEDLSLQSTLPEDQKKPALKKLDALLRAKLLEAVLPKEVSEAKVSEGILTLRVDGEFEILLTLGYRGHLSLWRILHLKLLVGEKGGSIKLEETRRYALGDDLERRMAVAENPLSVVYSILHELSVALVMDTVIRQVQVLRQGRWKDVIRFDLITDGSSGQGGNLGGGTQLGQDGELDSSSLKTPGLKIVYWFDPDKVMGVDLSTYPFIKIEPSSDMQIKCSHSVFVLDPFSDKEAEFSLDLSCIDVEKLLLRAITCYRHTRLLEIYTDLCKNSQIFQASDDVILQRQEIETDAKQKDNMSANEYWRDEVLRVRAYGSIYISLGVNIRNGRFFLQSSKNVIEPSVLIDYEDALNQGTMTAVEVFVNLRSKSIYHLIASTGRFLGLKVYEQGLNTLRIPKSILSGSDFLIMGFPQSGASFYLMMQLNRDFTPAFKLLEAEPDPGTNSHSVGENKVVARCNEIDISQMELFEDELNLSLTDWNKLKLTFRDSKDSTIAVEHNLPQNLILSPFQSTGVSQSTFSELVDEIFEYEKGIPTPIPMETHQSSSSLSPFSLANSSQGVKGGLGSPKLEEGLQYAHITNNVKASSGGLTMNGSLYQMSSLNGLAKNSSLASFVPSRNLQQMLPRSKSDQDLGIVQSPQYSGDNALSSSVDDNQAKLRSASPIDASLAVSRPVQVMSPLRSTGATPLVSTKQSGIKNQGQLQSVTFNACDDTKQNVNSKKRCLADILPHVPSLLDLNSNTGKRMKLSMSSHSYPHVSNTSESLPPVNRNSSKCTFGGLLAEANHGLTSSNMYLASILHVVRHCSLCIKHARLTSQMESLGIPYVEEVGLRSPSSSLWFRLPFAREDSWKRICLRLGKPGSMSWDVKVNDSYFKDLWELQKGSPNTPWGPGVRIANASDMDSHIRYDPDGIVLSYKTVESDSIKKLVSDLKRLLNARLFACGMRNLLSVRCDEVTDDSSTNIDTKVQAVAKGIGECNDKVSEQIRRVFKIEAVGLMSLWFSYGSMPVMVHFVVEWEASKDGCTIHVSPDQLWPHTKFLEDYINAAEVASFLDCVRLTAGPLMALGTAIRPARMPTPSSGPSPLLKQPIQSQGPSSNTSSLSTSNQPLLSGPGTMVNAVNTSLGGHSLHSSAMLSAAGRAGPGIVPSSLLPIDVSVVLRGPYWIRIIYRKKFAVDMRCYAGDQVWLQPSTPPKDGPLAGGSLPCPQFRPFIMEHVAQGLNALEPTGAGGAHTSILANPSTSNQNVLPMVANGTRPNVGAASGISRPNSMVGGQGTSTLNRVGNAMLASSSLAAVASGLPLRISPGTGVPVHVKGELNTAFIGLGDDGGYGGGWVPLAALKKVLRGILKYLGVLWLFAQLPELLKDILGSILKENEGTLLNLDQEQPALRFYVGGYVFAVSVHRVQLLLQVLSVKRFHHQQQQQTQSSNQEELSSSEISEICDYFSRRVASEPYDASRVASFITLLTLPISVLREFLKLLAWEKGLSQSQVGDIAPAQRARVELCLENHSGMAFDENLENASVSKSNIHHDRPHSSVDFALTFVLDPALIPHVNAAGGAAWLPYCVSIRLKYMFGENAHISLVTMDGSHGGRACWSRLEDWEICRQRISRAVDIGSGNASVDISQGKLRLVAETMQKILQSSLQQLKDAATASNLAST